MLKKTLFTTVVQQSSVLLSLCYVLSMPVQAQTTVNPDGTVGTAVIPDGSGGLLITGGTQQLTTLFHSFSDFSPEGTDVLFLLDGAQSGVDTVIGRVTGSNVSLINSQLGLFGGNNPDLYLINPNGITLGPNASLALPGSFLASTADSVVFADNVEFSAIAPAVAPMLTVSTPIGLNMGNNPGDIQVNNSGHNITLNSFSPLDLSTTPLGLAVQPGQEITLVGGNVTVDGGRLFASSGHLNLAALASGQFSTQPDSSGSYVATSSTSVLGDISLESSALLNVSGFGSGDITLQGDNIYVEESSVIVEQNYGSLPGGVLRLSADNDLTVDGGLGALPSQIITQNFGLGEGGDVVINAQDIVVTKGSFVGSNSYGPAPAGDVQVASQGEIFLTGAAVIDPSQPSTVGSWVFSSGDAATVTVDAETILITDSASISSLTAGAGQGGDLSVTATESITLIGESAFSKSSIDTVTFGAGNAGSVTVTTPRLSIQEGAGVLASTHDVGNGGDILLNISELLEVRGTPGEGVDRNPTLVGSSAVSLANTALGILVGLPEIVEGDAGNVTINASNIVVSDRGALSVGVIDNGLGDTGDLTVNADILKLEQQGNISALTFAGDGGNVYLNVDTLLSLQERGQIDVRSLSNGNGGNIYITAPVILGVGNSDIVANAVTGNGGNINIQTQGIVGLAFRNQLTPESDITASSEFGIDGSVVITNLGEEIAASLVELPDNLEDRSRQITQGCGVGAQNFVMTGRGGSPQIPTESLTADNVWSDTREPYTADDIAVSLENQSSAANSLPVEAIDWQISGTNGRLELIAPNTVQPSLQSVAMCLKSLHDAQSMNDIDAV
ncbi:MAG: S-layer family protein [Cyanobacteria bacterium P01_D01_bin.156]